MKSEWKRVEQSVFMEKLKNYPRKLVHNFFMDWDEWYDFSLSTQADGTSKVFKSTRTYSEEYWVKCFSE